MQVKAQGLLNAAKWIETEYGRDALGEVVRSCSAPVRDRYVSAIGINWHPVEEFIEFVEAAERILGRGKGQLAEEIGAAGARANLKGTIVRIAFYLAQPEFLFRRVAGLWQQFNDEGHMLLHALEEHTSVVEVAGILQPNRTFCAVLTGWTRQISLAIGIQNPSVRHVECRARGEARCIWEIRWVAIEPGESVNRVRSASERMSSGRVSAAGPISTRSALPSSPPASGKASASDAPAPVSRKPPSSRS